MDAQPLDRRAFLAAGIGAAVGVALHSVHAESPDLAGLTLAKASELLRTKAVSSVDLTQACLKRIETYNPALNAFITVTSEQALAAAREMDAEQRRGKRRGPLHGIPVAVKDNIDTAGIRTTARAEIKSAFTTIDLLVTPTMAGPPSPIMPIEDSAGLDPGRTRNTWPFDVSGLPAISVPCGFTSSGLPIGLQIAGAPFAEPPVLALAHAYEQATEWHTMHPKSTAT